jgi:hypothetical protein
MPMSPDEREEFGKVVASVATVEGRTNPKLIATYLGLILGAIFATVIPFGVYTIRGLSEMHTEVALLRMHIGLAMVDNKAGIEGTLNKPKPPPKPPAQAATVAMMEYVR